MAIPDYQSITLPLLRLAGDGNICHIHDAYSGMVELFALTAEEKRTLLPSGKQKVIDNRVGWARTYLVKAGLLQSSKRGYFQITAAGQAFLKTNAETLTVDDLSAYDSFNEFMNRRNTQKKKPRSADQNQTPEEVLEQTTEEMQQDLAQELLSKIKECTPDFFEHLVVDLLVSMGYGGSRKEAGEVIGRSGDGGIDGIIKEDKLGLDTIYLQAKRWEGSVGRPNIQRFVGALQGVRARGECF